MVSQLATMVRKAGEQQREIVMELSKELSKHNKLIERALDKQERMIGKVERIEEKLMKKEIYNYEKITDAIEKKKAL